MFIKRQDIIWELKPYLRIGETSQYEFHVWMNKPLADWDVFDVWEKERVRHMRRNLERGEILFDIGAEMGWLSVVYGQLVHPSNMVLIEPTPEFWPNIQAIWHKNFDCEPLATYHGLFSDKSTNKVVDGAMHEWPKAADGDLIDKLAYTYIHENKAKVPEITIDDYVKYTGIVPNALTMDTEGSELLILKGARDTLERYNLKLWVSIHPDLGERDYGVKKQATIDYLESLGYSGNHIATDHEEHWFFKK